MTTLELTREEILEDIKGYQERICKAQEKLSELPATVSTVKERRRVKNKRRIFLTEIDHVQGLISIAEEALNQF